MDIKQIMGLVDKAKYIPGMPKDILNRINGDIVGQAINMSSKYSKDKKGIMQAITDLGSNGKQVCDKINGLINNPFIRFGAEKLGVKKSFLEDIVNITKGNFKNENAPPVPDIPKINNSSLKDRLDKLR